MVLIGGFVWGGFAYFLVRALKSERAQGHDDRP